jgi:hypothetical protein
MGFRQAGCLNGCVACAETGLGSGTNPLTLRFSSPKGITKPGKLRRAKCCDTELKTRLDDRFNGFRL